MRMTLWAKLRALPSVWRCMDALILSLGASKAAGEQLAQSVVLMRDASHMLEAQQEEVARLNRIAAEDARWLLAYARWCKKQGCAPSSSELLAMVPK